MNGSNSSITTPKKNVVHPEYGGYDSHESYDAVQNGNYIDLLKQ